MWGRVLMGFEDVFRLLEERRTAVGVELDRLELEADRIAGLIASRREELGDLQVASRVISQLPARHVPAVVVADPDEPGASDTPLEVFIPWVLGKLGESQCPVRCRELVRALGEDPGVARNVERVWHRLKKLVQDGRVVEPQPGVFTLAGVDAPAHG